MTHEIWLHLMLLMSNVLPMHHIWFYGCIMICMSQE